MKREEKNAESATGHGCCVLGPERVEPSNPRGFGTVRTGRAGPDIHIPDMSDSPPATALALGQRFSAWNHPLHLTHFSKGSWFLHSPDPLAQIRSCQLVNQGKREKTHLSISLILVAPGTPFLRFSMLWDGNECGFLWGFGFRWLS